jgi:GGDEF domain-containing protein
MNAAFEATATFPLSNPGRLAALLGRLANPLGTIPHGSLDRSTGLYNRAGLAAAADAALRRSGDDAALSAIVLEFGELQEVWEIYGPAVGRKVVAKIVRRLRVVAGLRGLIGRTGPSHFTIVLPGTALPKAQRKLHRGLGKPARVEFDAGDSELVLVPEVVVDEAEPGCEGVQALLREMNFEMARMRKQERRRLDRLTVERLRHSRPMPIHS